MTSTYPHEIGTSTYPYQFKLFAIDDEPLDVWWWNSEGGSWNGWAKPLLTEEMLEDFKKHPIVRDCGWENWEEMLYKTNDGYYSFDGATLDIIENIDETMKKTLVENLKIIRGVGEPINN